MMTKTVSVLARDWVIDDEEVLFSPESDDGEAVTYPAVSIGWETYVYLGQPEKITLTIEPGDLLNA